LKPSIDRLEVAPSWGAKIDGIEGLRGVAALAVASGHTIILLKSPHHTSVLLGSVTGLLLHGLTLFFVVSGFLLYRPFASAALNDRPAPTARAFLANRILRIWPAYLVILLFVGLVLRTAVTGGHGPGEIGGNEADLGCLTDPLTWLANLFLVQGLFPRTFLTGLGVSWSLVTEVSFYLLLPLLGLLATRCAHRMPVRAAALVPALVLFVVGATGRVAAIVAAHGKSADEVSHLRTEATWSAVIYRSILTQGDLFALGMFAAVVVLVAKRQSPTAQRRIAACMWACVALAMLFVLAVGGDLATPAMGLFFAAGIVLISLPHRDRLSAGVLRILDARPFRAVGLISYSFYLWHFSLIWFIRLNVDGFVFASPLGLIRSVVGVLVLTAALSAVTYRYVELPAMRRKVRTGVEETP
jgi:peptidoglycan/LPS O-acetylase OafA/YrhL